MQEGRGGGWFISLKLKLSVPEYHSYWPWVVRLTVYTNTSEFGVTSPMWPDPTQNGMIT